MSGDFLMNKAYLTGNFLLIKLFLYGFWYFIFRFSGPILDFLLRNNSLCLRAIALLGLRPGSLLLRNCGGCFSHAHSNFQLHFKAHTVADSNLCGLEPQLIKLEFIIYLPKLKVSRACRPVHLSFVRSLRLLLL